MNKFNVIVALVMLLVGLGGGFWLSGALESADKEVVAKDNKPLFYRNPMNPSITSPVPAKGSMGMDYVPVYADKASSNNVIGTVEIDPVVVQNMGVRTEKAKIAALSRTVRAVGRVDFDEERMVKLHPKVDGWIEEMRVDKTGENVSSDDILLSLYSPKLVSTQQEYLLALKNFQTLKDSPFDDIRIGSQDLVKSSRGRLQMLDVAEHQIQELESSMEVKKSLHIHTPVSGSVIRIGARQGQYVTPKTELYMIVDLSRVWVYADIYEYELPWVKVGDKVEMTLRSVPGRTFTGSLAYIYPYGESKTRTTKVRMVFENPEKLLRPDMFADILIQSDTQSNAVIIPSEAVVRSGGGVQVFVVRGPGKFEPRLVTLGIESNGQVTVVSGVQAGEEVVTSAQFLIDSESKLREATAKMMSTLNETNADDSSSSAPQSMDHSSMQMKEEEDADMKMDHSSMGGERSHD